MAAPRSFENTTNPGTFGEDEPTREFPRDTSHGMARSIKDPPDPALESTTTVDGVPNAPLPKAEPFPQLTPRERQIALLLVIGSKNSEIATELGVSVKTVDTHRAAILRKTSKRNNVELALLACREGWIIP